MADNDSQGLPVNSEPMPAGPPGRGGLKGLLILAAGVTLLAVGGGYSAAMLTGGSAAPPAEPAPAAAPAPAPAPEPPVKESPPPGGEKSQEFVYFDFEPVVVNLDEPRLARYVRVTITLVIRVENHAAAKAILEKRKPELKNWLTTYFASCTLDGVRGAASLNRLRREILDAFTQQLWPNQKPLIEQVLFKEFAVS